MPTDILMTDIRFPSEASLKGKKTDEKIGVITNYLYMLKEQLAYNMYHIGTEQLLPSVTDDINAPLYKLIEDQDGNIAELQLTAQGLSVSVQDALGNASLAIQTANSLATRVSNAEGDISSVTQLADALVTRVEDNEDNISTLTQTASSLSTRVTNAEGDASEALQTAQGFTLRSSVSGNTATIGLYNGNLLYGSAANITFSGFVTFTDLSRSGYTTINGDNITTGTIDSISINACDITGSVFNSLLDIDTNASTGEINFYLNEVREATKVGGLRFDYTSENTGDTSAFRVFLYTKDFSSAYPVSLKLQADSRMSLESDEHIWMKSGTVRILGTDVYLWGNIYINGNLVYEE